MKLVKVVIANPSKLEDKVNEALTSLGHNIIDIKMTNTGNGMIVAMIYYET